MESVGIILKKRENEHRCLVGKSGKADKESQRMENGFDSNMLHEYMDIKIFSKIVKT